MYNFHVKLFPCPERTFYFKYPHIFFMYVCNAHSLSSTWAKELSALPPTIPLTIVTSWKLHGIVNISCFSILINLLPINPKSSSIWEDLLTSWYTVCDNWQKVKCVQVSKHKSINSTLKMSSSEWLYYCMHCLLGNFGPCVCIVYWEPILTVGHHHTKYGVKCSFTFGVITWFSHLFFA